MTLAMRSRPAKQLQLLQFRDTKQSALSSSFETMKRGPDLNFLEKSKQSLKHGLRLESNRLSKKREHRHPKNPMGAPQTTPNNPSLP